MLRVARPPHALRHALRANPPVILTIVRGRAGSASKKSRKPSKVAEGSPGFRTNSRKSSRSQGLKTVYTNLTQVLIPGAQLTNDLNIENVSSYLGRYAKGWSKLRRVRERFTMFGIPSSHLGVLLNAYVSELEHHTVLSTIQFDETRKCRLLSDLKDEEKGDALDMWYSRLFYEWSAHPSNRDKLSQYAPSTIDSIVELYQAASLSDPSSFFPMARSASRRKVIMHVGPTNSGKTHNALRALAAARMGCYAGPLRLLAHEIFERLNKGQIMPLGAELEAEPEAEPDPDTNLDVPEQTGGKAIVRKDGNPRWARACNLLTGEEQRIMDEKAGLVSCTVEMISTLTQYDVAVIDEIQLLSDKERGGAWTAAVLGLNAKELHLCGEEAAVPLVEEMLRDTGDELIVNRYQRLTPLKVAERSLERDLSKVRKGDCLVAFSRSGIFRLKNQIEKISGVKCAVAYGRLPPEIRSEQAALFNDPNSGYDILVGSDAVGMGLNLKIKRIIFESVFKFNGKQEQMLSIPQIKQIAGRAGRFGLHGTDDGGGVCTTLVEDDLPILRDALAQPPEPLHQAYISPTFEQIGEVLERLPGSAKLSTGMLVLKYVSRLHPAYEFQDPYVASIATDHIEKIAPGLTLEDKILLQRAPVAWRDTLHTEFMDTLIQEFNTELRVDIRAILRQVDFLKLLENVKKAQEDNVKLHALDPEVDVLIALESLHKCLIAYIWLAYRNPVAFCDLEYAQQLKQEVERSMEWYLDMLSKRFTTQGDRLPRGFKPRIALTIDRNQKRLMGAGGQR